MRARLIQREHQKLILIQREVVTMLGDLRLELLLQVVE